MRKEYESVPVTIADVQRMNDAMYNQSIPQEYRSAVVDTIARDVKHDDGADAYPKTLKPEERKKAAESIKAELKGKTGQERAEKRAELMEPGPSDDAASKWKGGATEGGIRLTAAELAKGAAANEAAEKAHKAKLSKVASPKIKAQMEKGGPYWAPRRSTSVHWEPRLKKDSGDASYDDADDAEAELKHNFKKGQMVRENRQGSKPERVMEIRGNSLYTERGGTLHVTKAVHHKEQDASYEETERKAIAGESKSKGSTSFNFGHNKPNATPSKGPGTSWKTKTPKNYEAEERKAIQSEGKGSTKFP
jgi:hypothetical protein